jgi:acyl transferase domain-containing protein
MRLNPPRIPVISNRTGQPLTRAGDQTPPIGWPTCAARSISRLHGTLARPQPRVFLEMGPGRALTSLAQANGVAAGR